MTSLLAAVPESRRGVAPVPAAPSADLLALADAELDRAADALHDGALQALVVARYAADAAVRGGDPLAARDAVQDALVTLRRAVWQLRPRGAGGLVRALDELSAARCTAGEPPLALTLDAAAAALLPAAAAAAAYRLVQACGGPDVRLSADGGSVVLDVAGAPDDVAAWRVRAQALGGELVTAPDHTILLVSVPPHGPTCKAKDTS